MNLGIILAVLMAVLTGVGQLLFKKATLYETKITNTNLLQQYVLNPWFYGAILVFVVSTLIWVKALEYGNVSRLFPIVSLSYIVIAVGAYYFFNEKLSLVNGIGMGVIVLGVGLISYGK